MQGHGHEEQGILFYSLLKHIASVIPVIFFSLCPDKDKEIIWSKLTQLKLIHLFILILHHIPLSHPANSGLLWLVFEDHQQMKIDVNFIVIYRKPKPK